MAKERQIVQHIRSSQVVDGAPKLPTAEQIEYGEIAINYAKGNETISLKNSENEIVSLSFKSSDSIKGVNVNNVEATVANDEATVVIEGDDMKVSSAYESTTYSEPFDAKVTDKGAHVDNEDNVDEAFKKVETTISLLVDQVIDDEDVTAQSVNALANAAGTVNENDEIQYVVKTDANYIKTATSVHDATVILDGKVKEVSDALANAGKVDDVKVNNTSVVNNKVASITMNSTTVKNTEDSNVVYPSPFEEDTNVNHFAADESVQASLLKTENTIKVLAEEIIKDENTTANAVDALANAAGTVLDDDSIGYVQETTANFIKTATSVHNATVILDDKLNGVELRSDGDLNYALYIDNTKHGEISIPKDQFLKSVTYDASTKELVFVFTTSTGEVTTRVSVADLVDTYTAGEGLSLSDSNVFSVDYTKVASVESLSNFITNINVNGVAGTVTNKIANATIKGKDVAVADTYTATQYAEEFEAKVTDENAHVAATDKVDVALGKVEKTISLLVDQVIDNEDVTAQSVNALANAAGTVNENDEIQYIVEENANYINTAVSVHNATVILDGKVKQLSDSIAGAGKVDDVKVNGTSVVENKIADITINSTTVKNTADSTITYPEEFEALTDVGHFKSTDSVQDSLTKTEKTINVLATELIKDENTTANAVDALANAAGTVLDDDSIGYVRKTDANYIMTATSVHDATVILDGAIKNVDNKIVLSNTNVEYPAPFEAMEGVQHINSSDSFGEAFTKTEKTIKALTDEILKNENVEAKSVAALANAAGTLTDDGVVVYVKKQNPNYIGNAQNLSDAINILDDKLKELDNKIAALQALHAGSGN